MIDGIGVVLNLTAEEANNLLVFLNRSQITGAEALPMVLIRQQIEKAIKNHAETVLAAQKTDEG